jgi:hypothetical protein
LKIGEKRAFLPIRLPQPRPGSAGSVKLPFSSHQYWDQKFVSRLYSQILTSRRGLPLPPVVVGAVGFASTPVPWELDVTFNGRQVLNEFTYMMRKHVKIMGITSLNWVAFAVSA